MPGPFGVSFVPGGDQQQGNGMGAPAQPSQALQQAIQFISARLPRVVGANALAPQQLLQNPGGAALGGNMNLEQLLAKLFGPGGQLAGGTPGAPMGGPPGGATFPVGQPGPKIIPGGGQDGPPPAPPPGPTGMIGGHPLPTPGAPQMPTWQPPQTPQVNRFMPGQGGNRTFSPGPYSVDRPMEKPY